MRRLASSFRNGLIFLFLAVLAVGSFALVADTALQGQDFAVFWRAGRAVLEGHPVYDLARDREMVFKYPPWVVPLFLPCALLPLFIAKVVWGVFELVSIATVCLWLKIQAECSWLGLTLGLISFWGIWAVHAMDGQVNLPMLAVSLLVWTDNCVRAEVVQILVLSTKIFTLFPLLGKLNSWKILRAASVALALMAVFSIPALRAQPGRNVTSLMRDWQHAALSGGELFSGDKVRGRDNQGFPALLLRASRIPASKSSADSYAAIFVGLVLASLWWRQSQYLDESEKVAGWFALAAVAHPLAWFHVFVFAFPLCVVAIDRAWKKGGSTQRILAAVGFLSVAVTTRRTLGSLGEWLELGSIKSWGVLFCAASLCFTKKAKVVVPF